MIQGISTLVHQSQKINEKVKEGAFVQKVQSSPTTFCLRLRSPGENVFLHIGRGKGIEGIWVEETAPEKEIRIKDRFDDWLKKNLIGLRLNSVEVDNIQRILMFNFSTKDSKIQFGVFYKGRNLNFSINSDEASFKSWVGKSEEFVPGTMTHKEMFRDIYDGPEAKQGEINTFDLQSHYKTLTVKKVNSRRKKLVDKKIKQVEEILKNIKVANEVQSKMYQSSEDDICSEFKKIGLRIKAKRGEGEHQFRNRAFSKIKNFKKSEEFIRAKKDDLLKEIEKIKEITVLKKTNHPVWVEPKSKKKPTRNIINFKYNDLIGAVGKNTKGNDFLRSKFGKSSDLWFHLEGDKSCHVVLKAGINDIDNELVEAIASLIRDTMKKTSTELRIIYSTLSEVRGIKGRPGSVTINNPNYFKVLYNPNWKEIISFD